MRNRHSVWAIWLTGALWAAGASVSAFAQSLPIQVDSSVPGARPVVGHRQGVPVIQIAPPKAGVSNNKFTHFNVDPSGVILNNSGAVSQTQLAGRISGNPQLGSDPATTILNQVTAPNPSQLRGLLEVAGQRANVIVANPAGITCDGCGFVNASRATLTTGRPVVGPQVGERDGVVFEITEGALQVNGQGLKATGTSQVDLLARAIRINAQVWADHLNVVMGAARVDGVTGQVTPIEGKGRAPQVSLDTAALGGMYANAIRLIGTERGLGVNTAGTLQALTGDLILTTEGEVRIAPQGALRAHGDLHIRATQVRNDRGRLEGHHVSIRADRLNNYGGTVQAMGDMDIAARWINNLNAHYVSDTVQVSVTPKVYYTPSGSTDRYDAQTTWLCDLVTPACGKHPHWLDDDPERRLLLPSARYPEAQYGPPFDYVPHKRGQAGVSSPIWPSHTPSVHTCEGPGGDAGCTWVTKPDQFHYAPYGRIWAAFGIAPPQGPPPVWHEPKARGWGSDERPRVIATRQHPPTPERRAYEVAMNTYKAPYAELDTRIRAFNQDFRNRLVKDFTYYEVNDIVTESHTVDSQPGRILAGGAMAVRGEVNNDKSQIVATGPLTIAGPALHNHGAGGTRTVRRAGQATFTQARHSDRKAHRWPHHEVLSTEPIQLPVGPSSAFSPGSLREQSEYGTLISGRDTYIALEGTLHNSGVIAPREAMVVRAATILNQNGGQLYGRLIDLQAREALRNVASQIQGNIVSLRAGQDIELRSVAGSDAAKHTSSTHLAGVSQVQADELRVAAGQDVKLVAARVAVEHNAHVQAGRDVHLQTLTAREGEAVSIDAHQRHERRMSRSLGSTVAVNGDLTVMAQRDLNAEAAQVDAQQDLKVAAGRDISVQAGTDAGAARDQSRIKKKGLLSSRTTDSVKSEAWQRAQASTLTGKKVKVVAGRHVTVVGSNIVGDHDVKVAIGGDLRVAGAKERHDAVNHEKTHKKGIGSGGGFSVGYHKQARNDTVKGDSEGHAASTLGSIEGDLTLEAAGNIATQASSLLAQRGDIRVQGGNVDVVARIGQAHQIEHHEFQQSGLTIGVAGGVVGAAQQAQHTVREAQNAQSGRLAAVKAGQAAYEAVQAGRMAAAEPSTVTEGQSGQAQAQIQISAGSTRASHTIRRAQENAFGSSVIAGGDVKIIARGKAPTGKVVRAKIKATNTAAIKSKEVKNADVTNIGIKNVEEEIADAGASLGGNIRVAGSDIVGKNVLLSAAEDLILQGVAQTSTETSKNRYSGWKAGVGVGASEGGGGINVFASGYRGRGHAKGNNVEHRETQLSARDNLTLRSGGDTVLIGAQARGDRIDVDTRGELKLVSQQDSDRFEAKQQQISAGGSFSFGSMTGTAYVGANHVKTRSRYDSVNEQTGLYAGKGGFAIEVGTHTQLEGAAIASDAPPDKNRLSTETLSFTNLENEAAYRATSTGMSMGTAGVFDIAENQGTILGGPPGGVSITGKRDAVSGTTHAAVAAGSIQVRADRAGGRNSAAGLHRDADSANGRIDRIFDRREVHEQLTFQQAFAQLGMQVAGDVAAQRQQENPELWAEQGAGRIALHAVVSGLGAVLGAGEVTGAIVGTIAGDLSANLVREHIEQAVQHIPEGSKEAVAKVIVNVVATTAGGLAGGTNGAGGAAAADRFNRQLHHDEGLLIRKHAQHYAKRHGISVAQASAELTGQAQRQTDKQAAEHYPENAAARAFLAEIATGLQNNGFAYFDGQVDESDQRQLQFAGGLIDSANLEELYNTAWDHLRSQPHLKMTGTTRALVDAADSIDHYATNAEDLAKLKVALLAERDHAIAQAKAWSERDSYLAKQHARAVRVLEEKLDTIKVEQNGGEYDLKDVLPEAIETIDTAMGALRGRAGGPIKTKGAKPDTGREKAGEKRDPVVREKVGAGASKETARRSDGISFNPNIKSHLSGFDGLTQKKGVSGTHNSAVFLREASKNGVKVISEVSTSVNGVATIRYKIPAYDRAGNVVGYKKEIFTKTVYDPKLISDEKILELGQKAAMHGYKDAINKGAHQYDASSGGVEFRVYLDKATGVVTNFHPK